METDVTDGQKGLKLHTTYTYGTAGIGTESLAF